MKQRLLILCSKKCYKGKGFNRKACPNVESYYIESLLRIKVCYYNERSYIMWYLLYQVIKRKAQRFVPVPIVSVLRLLCTGTEYFDIYTHEWSYLVSLLAFCPAP